MRRSALVVLATATAAMVSCNLREITVADAEYLVVAEMYLRAGAPRQTAILHTTITGQDTLARVPGADIQITDSHGARLTLVEAPDSTCFVPDSDPRETAGPRGTCYGSRPDANYAVTPGEIYTLQIRLPDGGVLTSATRVPGEFRIVRPAVASCTLPPATKFEMAWTPSDSAWVYAASAVMRGVQSGLFQQGIQLDFKEPLRLFGLSLSSRDTTITFPTGFGLFQRFDPGLTDVLIAIQDGLPPGVIADVTVAAADRNYVNWERGGNFNPSGTIRIASIRGDGTGVFGSLVPHVVSITVGTPRQPAC